MASPTVKSSNKTTNKVHNASSDIQYNWKETSLNGKLVTSNDGCLINPEDFTTLTNFEYTDTGIRSISGMTKITTAAPTTYTKHRSMFQFNKTSPVEQHLLAQSYNSAESSSIIQELTSEVPATGTFSATPVYTIADVWTLGTAYAIGDKVFPTVNNGFYYQCTDAGTSGATQPTWPTTELSSVVDNTCRWACKRGDLSGVFSKAPDGCMAYSNGEDLLIWGGDEYRVAKFINYDPSNVFFYDYTERVNNTSISTEDIAVITPTAGGIDSSTELLLHFEDNVTDSSSNAHTVTAVGSPAYLAGGKFSKALTFDNTNDLLTIPDHATFDLSSGSWSIDFWFKTAALGNDTIYYQGLIATPTNDYMKISTTTGGVVTLTIQKSGATDVSLSTGAGAVVITNWQHVEVTENGDGFYIFVNGALKAYTTSANRAQDYDGVVVIGATSDYNVPTYSEFLNGYLDEFRVSSRFRHTGGFTPMTTVYGTDVQSYCYVCSTMPISGIKFYLSTPNATTCAAPTINYWDGTTWTTVGTVTDGTLSGGKSMAVTGRMTFASTVALSKQKMLNNVLGYWYQIIWTTLDDTTSVYYTTLKTPMQKAKDIWDGSETSIARVVTYNGVTYTDSTTNVLKEDASTYYNGSSWIYPPESYLSFASFPVASSVYIGFVTRCTGITFSLPHSEINTTAATATIYYWNGAGWTTCGTIDDQTAGTSSTISLNHSGSMIWNPIDINNEYKTTVGTNQELYYYKIQFSGILAAATKVDYISGLRAQETVDACNGVVTWLNSLWMLGKKAGNKNLIKSTLMNTSVVFSGSGSVDILLGNEDEVITGCTLFSRYLNNIEETLIILKKDETWVVDGSNIDAIRPFKVSSQYGITGKYTLAVCDIGVEITPGVSRAVAIWQSSNGIMMFDNGALSNLSDDIENYFLDMHDTSKTERLNPDMTHKSVGFYDPMKKTYHWLFANDTSTTLNREYVYDIIKKKWSRTDRTTGLYLQTGLYVKDSYGDIYLYGAIDTGYIERLDYGNTFDGTSITSTFRQADKPQHETMFTESTLRNLKLIGLCSSSAAVVTLYWYGDAATTGTSLGTLDQSQTGSRIYQRIYNVNQSAVFHGAGATCVSSDSSHSFEPLAISKLYHNIRFQTNRRES